jgi:Ca2+-transporting ATPase
LILLLLGSALLSVLVGQYEDALSIAIAVLIVGSVAFFQELQSEQTLEALNTLIPHRCNVIRSGKTQNIDADELVPGDIIKLQTGDRVPADGRVLQRNSLFIDESSLTGESEPKEKIVLALPNLPEDASPTERSNMVFMGTLVTSGSATVLVVAISTSTEFGKTFQEMKSIETRRTPLQVKMDELGKNLSIFSLGIIVCIGLLGMFQGKSFLAMFNIGVSLAVAAIPEGLPICVTVTLALGVMRMAKRKAIVKKLPAVEALGCADYICCDKTGTLTQSSMTVTRIYCPALEDSFVVASSSNSAMKYDKSKSQSKMSNKAIEIGKFVASYNGHIIDISKFPCLGQLLDTACICNNSYFTSGSTYIGQSTEFALIECARQLGIVDRRPALTRLEEKSFSSDTKYMEVVCSSDSTTSATVFVKGAVEAILPRCSTYLALNNELMNFSRAAQERVLQHVSEMARDGLRIIGIACGIDDTDLTLCGVVGLLDPLRDGIPDAVHRIQTSGARVMMITGDAEETAIAVAKMAGIYEVGMSKKALSGREIEELSRNGDDVLASVIEEVAVCYRTSPRHKLSIVRALQLRGHCVAMTGDGVNDAPALKAADIGKYYYY